MAYNGLKCISNKTFLKFFHTFFTGSLRHLTFVTNKFSCDCMQRAAGGPNEDKGPRTKCGVLLNPIDVSKDAGEWTIRVDYKDKDGQRVQPRIKMVKVKLT